MRRSLLKLNERHLPKALRQALVLITLLLLPSAAWGQDPTIEVYYNSDVEKLWFYTSGSVTEVKYQWDEGSVNTYTVSSGAEGGFPVQAGTLKYWSESPAINPVSVTYYGLIIESIPFTNENVDENGAISGIQNVSFTAPATLSLNGATINVPTSGIIWKGTSDLTIQFSGNNKIDCTQSSGNNNDGICIFGDDESTSLILTAGTDASTLTLTPRPSATQSNNKPAIDGFGNVTLNSGWGMYYTDNYSEADPKNLDEDLPSREVIISNGKPYGISVGGVVVTEKNKNDILCDGNGKVSFAETIATLTLDNAQVNGTISSTIADLKVHLIGSSVFTVDTETTNAYWYNYTGADLSPNTPALTFSVESIGASLTLNATSSEYGHSVDIAPSDYRVVNTDADWTSWNMVTSGKYSGGVWFCKVSKPYLWVAGGEIDDSNKDNSAENHGFNGTNTVTLSGITPGNSSYDRAYARDNLIKSNIANLTVNVSGVNSLWMDSEEQTISSRVFSYTGASGSSSSLTLVMEEDASIVAMWNDNVTASLDYLIEGFAENNIETDLSEIQIGESGIFAQADENLITISNVEKYNLNVNGISVNSLNKDNIFEESTDTPTASFKDGVLTLKGATITTSGVNAIESGLANLEIKLIGVNTITCQGNSDIAFKGLSSGAKVTFTTDTQSPGELTVTVLEDNTLKDITLDFQNGLSSTRNGDNFTIGVTNYGLTVSGVSVTSANCDDILKGDSYNKGKVFFTPADDNSPATLTLNNANIGEIISRLSSLTIHVIGENTTKYIQADPDITAATLTLEKEDANSVLTFDLTGISIDSFIFGFTSFTNNDFTLFGFDGSSTSALSGSFTYDTSNQSLKWSDSSTHLTKMVACILFEGEGTESSPYQIKAKEDLAKMSTFVGKGVITNQYFKVVTDIINCSGLDFTPIPTFFGTFDGGGNTIENLTFETSSSTNSIGLFSKLGYTDNGTDYSGTIKNLKLTSCSFIGGSDAGAIVGELWTGTVQNCEVTSCTIQSGDAQSPRVGGIAGDLYKGIIQGCKVNNTTITASTIYTEESGLVSVGGIVGNVYSECEVTECETTSITINAHHSAGSSNAGGIAGSFEGSTLKDNTVNGSQEAMTTISSKDTAENFTAGAIVGNVSTGIAMENNIYYYTVTITSGKGTSNENTKDKYTHRGTGSANYDANSDEGVKDPEGIAMYTKKVIIPLANNQQSGGNVGNVMVDLYYMKSGEDNTIYNVAPGEEIVLFVEYYALKGSYTLNGETEPITLKNTESNDWYSFDMPDADVTFTLQEAAIVHFSEEGEQSFATYYNATKDMAVPMGMTAYMVTGISEDGTKIIVSPVSYIKAGVAVLIEKDKTTEVSETTDFSGSKLVYAENDVPATENTKLYVLYNNKYVKVTAGTKILSGSCYLNLSGVANTRGFYEIGGGEGTTSLREVKTDVVNSKKWADGEWYTLQGQRIVKPAKGLYILNGKKVVVK